MSTRSKKAPTAIADVSAGTILATVDIDAPAERVFTALTSADDVVRWWGSDATYRTQEWSADVRPGGRWRAAGINNDGTKYVVEGEFLEVDAPRKLVQTWKADWDGSAVTKLTYRLESIESGTRLTLRHEGFADRAESCRAHAEGWEMVLGWLNNFVTPERAPVDLRYFMCRLIPPRPTFAQDMSADERAIMQKHVAYWTQMLERGTAIVFGPVADPKGGWGLGVIRAKSEDEMNGLRDGDPTIQSGLGFRYEILPMIRAVVRD
jgi:uncharacterized protein YndB with AHSA1/START domain